MATYICGACEKEFNDREVICEDRTIPEKSFICPHCTTPLEKPNGVVSVLGKFMDQPYLYVVVFVAALFLNNYFELAVGETRMVIWGFFIAVIFVAAYCIFTAAILGKWEAKPYDSKDI